MSSTTRLRRSAHYQQVQNREPIVVCVSNDFDCYTVGKRKIVGGAHSQIDNRNVGEKRLGEDARQQSQDSIQFNVLGKGNRVYR
jgi:hypothetical protein